MQLYKLLTDTEKKAIKALNIRNVHLNDLTIDELSQMVDHISIVYDEHEIGAIRVIKEIYRRHYEYQNKETTVDKA